MLGKTLSDAVFLLKAENCLLKWLPKKGDERISRDALFFPVICYHSKIPVNIVKDILAMNLAFRSLRGWEGIWHTNWSIMVNAKQSGLSNSPVLCWFLSVFPGFAVVMGLFVLGWFCVFFPHSASFLFSCSLLSLITVIVHGLLSLKIICCLVYLPCTWFIHSCSSLPRRSDWGVKSLISTEQRKQFHLFKGYKERIIKLLQW